MATNLQGLRPSLVRLTSELSQVTVKASQKLALSHRASQEAFHFSPSHQVHPYMFPKHLEEKKHFPLFHGQQTSPLKPNIPYLQLENLSLKDTKTSCMQTTQKTDESIRDLLKQALNNSATGAGCAAIGATFEETGSSEFSKTIAQKGLPEALEQVSAKLPGDIFKNAFSDASSYTSASFLIKASLNILDALFHARSLKEAALNSSKAATLSGMQIGSYQAANAIVLNGLGTSLAASSTTLTIATVALSYFINKGVNAVGERAYTSYKSAEKAQAQMQTSQKEEAYKAHADKEFTPFE